MALKVCMSLTPSYFGQPRRNMCEVRPPQKCDDISKQTYVASRPKQLRVKAQCQPLQHNQAHDAAVLPLSGQVGRTRRWLWYVLAIGADCSECESTLYLGGIRAWTRILVMSQTPVPFTSVAGLVVRFASFVRPCQVSMAEAGRLWVVLTRPPE